MPSYSDGTDGDSCVETATTPDTIHIRDSKIPAGPRFHVTPSTWAHFVSYATDNGRLSS
ncbi:DUF397 domain-containing protein [Streptomyces sp. SA15]|uniref:DUF397 domain-containing protein n=1 Tax=Streptomyces sp. SA15 TaxID=934019 RepID=UPI000BAF2500|nr:DUF397 domain-containing protein [Streptomyces sp. SA15]PAZ17574.1 DUF397 domain-containing protein [Streptomyces sp. SA15]